MSKFINFVALIFMILGIIDWTILNNRFDLGKPFRDGLLLTSNLLYIMTGLMVLAPMFGEFIGPKISPIMDLLKIDPGMVAGVITAVDMGAYPLAASLTDDLDIIIYSGIVLSSLLGVIFVFVIPTSLSMTQESDAEYLALGVAIGLISIFPGAIIAGLYIGMSLTKIFINSWPIFILIFILSYSLVKKPEKILGAFKVLGKAINVIIAASFIIIAINLITGMEVIQGITQLEEQIIIVVKIGLIMAGIYPLFSLVTKIFSKQLGIIAKKLNVDRLAVAALISAPINSFIVYETINKIDNRGKVIAMSFATPIGAIFTAHMAYTLEVAPDYLTHMMIAKAISGVFGLIIAERYTRSWIE